MFRRILKAILAIQKLKRIVNRTVFDIDMVDERFRNGKTVSIMTAIFQDGGQTDKFRRKMFRRILKAIMLAILELKRFASRIIFDRDMVDERFCDRKIVSVMTAIFQDGGQTDKFRRKMFRIKFKDHHVAYSKTQTNSKSGYIRQRYCR